MIDKKLKILLIEDNPDDMDLFMKFIGKTSLKPSVTVVTHIKSAIEKLANEKFDIILLDLNLPDSNAEESLQRIKKEFAQIPVVILSSLQDDIEVTTNAINAGAQDYLVKDKLDSGLIEKFILHAIERDKLVRDKLKIYEELKIKNRDLEKANQTIKESEIKFKQAKETAEQSVKLKDEFLANMSHEIRTPMNSIIGFANLLKDSSLNQIQQRQLNNIIISGENLLSIINDILDYSKIKAGMIILEQRPI